MTTEDLIKRVDYGFRGHGHYNVTIRFRGKEYRCVTTNMMAIDAAGDDSLAVDRDRYYTTQKQALLSLYNECKLKNDLV